MNNHSSFGVRRLVAAMAPASERKRRQVAALHIGLVICPSFGHIPRQKLTPTPNDTLLAPFVPRTFLLPLPRKGPTVAPGTDSIKPVNKIQDVRPLFRRFATAGNNSIATPTRTPIKVIAIPV